MKKIKNNFLISILLLWNLFFSFYFLFKNNMVKINAFNQAVSASLTYQEIKNTSKAAQTLKFIFPKLQNNDLLLDRILDKILEEFDNEIYSTLLISNKKDKLKLLEKYNILLEFPDAIAQIKFNPSDVVFAFIGNTADFQNYQTYLEYKKNGFQGPKSFFWKNWNGPSNFHLILKNDIEFWINIFETILQYEKQIQEQNLQSEQKSYISDYLINLQNQIDNYKYIYQQLQNTNQQLRAQLVTYQQQIETKTQEIQTLTEQLTEQQTILIQHQQELQTVQNNFQEINQQLTRYQTLTTTQQESLTHLQQQAEMTKNNLEGKLKTKEQELQNLKTDLQNKLRDLENLQQSLETDRQINTQEKTQHLALIETQKQNINALKTQLNNLEQKNQQLQNTNQQLRAQLVTYQQQIETKTQEIQTLTEQLTEQQTILIQHQQELQTVQNNFQEINQQLTRYQTLTTTQQESLTHLQQQAEMTKNNLEGKLKTKEQELQNLKTDLQNKLRDLENLQQSLETDRQINTQEKTQHLALIETQKQNINALKTQLNNLEQKNQQLQNTNQQLRAQLVTYQQQIETKTQEIQTLTEQLTEQQTILIQHQQELQTVQNNFQEINQQLTRYQTLTTTQQESLTHLQQQAEMTKNNLEGKLKTKEQELQNLKTDLQNKLRDLENLQQSLETDRQINTQEKTQHLALIETQKQNINALKTQLNNLEQKNQQLQNTNQQLRAQLVTYQQQIETKTQEIQTLTEQLTEQQTILIQHQQELQTVQNNFQEINQQLTRYQTLTTTQQESLTHLQQQAEMTKNNLEGKLKTKEQELQNLKTDLQNKLRDLENLQQSLETDRQINTQEKTQHLALIETQKQNINALKTQLNNLEQKNQQLQNTNQQLRAQLVTYQQQIETKTQEIQTLTEQLTEQQTILIQHQQELQTVQNNFQEINQQLTRYQTLTTTQQESLTHLQQQAEMTKNNLEGKLKTKEQELQNLKTDLQNKLRDLENLQQSLETDRQINTQEKTQHLALIETQKQNINALKTQLNNLEQKNQQLQNTNQQLRAQLVTYQQQIETKTQEIQTLTEQLTEQIDLIKQYDQRIDALNLLIQQKEEEINTKENLSEEQIKKLKEEILHFKNKLNLEFQIVSTQKTQLLEIRKQLQQSDLKLLDLKKEIQASHNLTEKQKQLYITEIAEKQTQIKMLSEQLYSQEKKVELAIGYTQAYTEFFKSTIETQNLIVDKLNKNLDIWMKIQNKQKQQLTTEDSRLAQQFMKNTKDFPGFKNVIGMKPIISQLKEVLDYLLHKDLYKSMGLKKTQKGILLYGPPGTGKTFLAQVFAKESGLPFFALSSDDFSKKYFGDGPKLINDIFEEARKYSPSIILIDECDAVFKSRVSDFVSSDHDNVISSFLSQMEGVKFDKNKPVFVIGTTNYINHIDPAILSRFNRLIKVDTWSKTEINDFLKKKSKEYSLDIRTEQYLDKIIEQIHLYSGDEIKTPRKMIELLDQSASIAISHKHFHILPEDLQLSFERLINNVSPQKWEVHKHQKHDIHQLLSTQYYKNIPIQHLYKDSDFQYLEKKYFQLIAEKYISTHGIVYNTDDDPNNIQMIEFLKDKTEINYNYNSPYPLNDELLGFYFEYDHQQTTPQHMPSFFKLSEIKSIEHILNEAHKYQVKKVYFIWNLNKKEENQKISSSLIKKYTDIYSFLTFDSEFHRQFQAEVTNIHNNMIDLEQFILRYIENIKNNLLQQVLEQIELSHPHINFQTNPLLKESILQKANLLWEQQSNIFSLSDFKHQMINDIKINFETHQRAEKRSYNKLI